MNSGESKPTDNSNEKEIAMNYAWDWFEYHASQRMTAFNYFCVLIGFAAAGYLKCLELAEKAEPLGNQDKTGYIWWLLTIFIGLFGLLFSISFYLLDIRNLELVNCSSHALKVLESPLGLTLREDGDSRKYLGDSLDMLSRKLPKPLLIKWVRHLIWLRSIMIFAALAFLIGIVYAIFRLCT
jgi:hypothetical protein